jgi:NADP-dependent 3-hydroxy acid dehydrogenase YdfG
MCSILATIATTVLYCVEYFLKKMASKKIVHVAAVAVIAGTVAVVAYREYQAMKNKKPKVKSNMQTRRHVQVG